LAAALASQNFIAESAGAGTPAAAVSGAATESAQAEPSNTMTAVNARILV
jgi:hypothetical protein